MILVRNMLRKDAEAVWEIDKATSMNPMTVDALVGEIRNKNSKKLVAVDGHKIVGFIFYTVDLRRIHGKIKRHVEMSSVAVSPPYQRQGVGSLLIKRSLIGAKTSGCLIADDCLPGHCLLRANGFLAKKVVRRCFDDGSDGYEFELAVKSCRVKVRK